MSAGSPCAAHGVRERPDRGASLVEVVVAVLLLGLLGTGLLAMTSGAALSAGNRQRQSDIQTVLAAAADSLSGITPVACAGATTAYQDAARARLTALGLGGGWTTAVLTVTNVQSWNASAGAWDSSCVADGAVHKVTIKVTPPSAASQARSLDVLTGAGTATVFRRVTLPLILPGVVSGWLLAAINSFDEVTMTVFIASPATVTLPVRMFLYIQDNIDPLIAAVSACLIAMTAILLFALDRLFGLDRLFVGSGKG